MSYRPHPRRTEGPTVSHSASLPRNMETEIILQGGHEEAQKRRRNGVANKLSPSDRPAHDWYRFVLSYPPHLVRDYLERFGLSKSSVVLDPFCGTGTTLVECKKRGIQSVGVEAHPMAHFATTVKVDWTVDPDRLLNHAEAVADCALSRLAKEGMAEAERLCLEARDYHYGLRSLAPELRSLLLTGSISPLPLHRTLVSLDTLSEMERPHFVRHERLGLAKALVGKISNLEFGPEVGVGPAKTDVAAVSEWLAAIRAWQTTCASCIPAPARPPSYISPTRVRR